MIRLFLILIFLFQISCSALTGFITGVAGNITSDTFGRISEDDCENDTKRNGSNNGIQFIYISEPLL